MVLLFLTLQGELQADILFLLDWRPYTKQLSIYIQNIWTVDSSAPSLPEITRFLSVRFQSGPQSIEDGTVHKNVREALFGRTCWLAVEPFVGSSSTRTSVRVRLVKALWPVFEYGFVSNNLSCYTSREISMWLEDIP